MLRIILGLLIFVYLFANVDNILYKIAIKNDLSNKTKKENSGILYLLTREDINSLEITHLRDVLKILPITYKFNRFGVIDPFNPNTAIPFLSSPIKIFIDNQEVVSALYNSGLAILGDIDIKWVDHIEIYTQAPSLEVSTEPSLIVIKLYSKDAFRDEGNNLYLSKGNKDTYLFFEKAKIGKYSYYTYLSNDNEKSDYHNSQYRKQFLLKIYNNHSNILAYILLSKSDGFLGFSLDGKVDDSFLKNKVFHFGYERKIKDFNFYLGANFNKNHTYYYETPVLFVYENQPIKKVNIKSFDKVVDINLKYKKEFNGNILLLGSKNRFKNFNWSKIYFDDIKLPVYRHRQDVYTIFMQYSKFLSVNSLVNFGYSFSYFDNDWKIKDQKTKQYRISHTFLKKNFVFKTAFSHIEYTLDSYLINSFYINKLNLLPAVINNIFEDIKYENFKNTFEFAFGYFRSKHYFFPNNKGILVNLDTHMNEKYLSFRYENRYKPFSKFNFSYFFHYIKDIPNVNIYRIHSFVIYNYNQIKKINAFEELVIDKEENSKFYYDLSLGLRYIKNDNLSFFIKGENILNKAKKYNFFSFNPLTNRFNNPISVPLIERRIDLGMEYSF